MLVGDPFVAMGATALETRSIRLGTGVLVSTNRNPAVTACAFATLNGMARPAGSISVSASASPPAGQWLWAR